MIFIVYEACIVYSHHLSMFLFFDPIIVDLIFSFHVLRKIALRDYLDFLEASREFVVCLFLGSCVSVSKSVCFVIFL